MTTYILGHFLIAGLPYRTSGEVPWKKLGPESPVRLVRERFNPHDFQCVSVTLEDGTLLGYLRRDDNPIPAALLDQGASLQARIAHIRLDETGDPQELRIEIALPKKV